MPKIVRKFLMLRQEYSFLNVVLVLNLLSYGHNIDAKGHF